MSIFPKAKIILDTGRQIYRIESTEILIYIHIYSYVIYKHRDKCVCVYVYT